MNSLFISGIRDKLAALETTLNAIERGGLTVPDRAVRDIHVVSPIQLPPKPGFSLVAGQARLLHDLASIELQAMELAVRTLIEFPGAPNEFRDQLRQIALDEGRHLALCLDGMEEIGYRWGSWATHCMLWDAVAPEDSLLDRVLIVHRYLEGSGLDAGETLQRRLKGVPNFKARAIVDTIAEEEIGHVEFGSRWYRDLCRLESLDPDCDFAGRLMRVRNRLPRRIENLALERRIRAGFSPVEIDFLQELRSREMVRSSRAGMIPRTT
jgi:uncharacterized ferritin-like protein (DUF455 family)